jgi:GTP-binding protein
MTSSVGFTYETPHFMTTVTSFRITTCEFTGAYFIPRQFPSDGRLQIAFAGRSNVGKSTLLNSLVGRKKLAKVSADPGKTRSINFYMVNNRFYFVDLPGYGYAKVSQKVRQSWPKLIADYLTVSPTLIGLILLLDCRRDLTPEDRQLVEWLSHRKLPVLVVVTKTDKLNRDKTKRKVQQVETQLGVAAIAFSALTGTGRKELLGSINNLLSEHYERIEE